jgi:hypothetical protein
MATSPPGTVVIEAASREGLLATFGNRSKHLTWTQIRKRFDDLLHHGYADTRRGPDGKWTFVLMGKRTLRGQAVS